MVVSEVPTHPVPAMSRLRQIALHTPFLKEVALRQLDVVELRGAILSGEIPSDMLHELATRAIADPGSPVLSSKVLLSAAEFAALALQSGKLHPADQAGLVVIATHHWDLRLAASEYVRAIANMPGHAEALISSGHEDAIAALENGLAAGSLPSAVAEDVRERIDAWRAAGAEPSAGRQSVKDRVADALEGADGVRPGEIRPLRPRAV